ncbi:hypothetical protein V3W47_04290 [Deinococcus sp. YIM 134068]|uniref:Agd3-related carbohydrate-binding protein n=1 Tax=Deinococcus lichenicola TaxID=3118910 RepID=UPI002F9495BF
MKLAQPLLPLTLLLALTACGGGPSVTTPVAEEVVGENGVKLSEITRYGEVVYAPGGVTPTGATVGGPSSEVGPQGVGAALRGDVSGARLGPAVVPRSGTLRAQALPANAQKNKVALRILVLHAGANDFGLAPARALLRQHGIPFDTLDATSQALTTGQLIGTDGVGRYAGVVLASNALTTESSPGVYTSALDDAEWATLFEYEAAFGVRQLALFGYPGVAPEDYGVRAVPGTETATTDASVTTDGKAVFTDLTAKAVPVRYAYAYPARLESVVGVSTQPLLQDGAGNVLAVTSTAADGRERLLLTMAQNEYLNHTQLLGPGLIGWLTRGVFLGEYRRFLGVDIDDWFAHGDHYDPATRLLRAESFRLSAGDALATRTQQDAVRSTYPVASNFRYAIMYNGLGADILAPRTCTPGSSVKDPLSAVSKCLRGEFDWVNHTRDHASMDALNYAASFEQIFQNTLIGLFMGLKLSEKSLVTGEHSGLGYKSAAAGQPKQDFGLSASNPNLLSAAQASGVRYLASNRSVPSQWDPNCLSCGLFHPMNKNVLLVPRWPNNVHYYATTPEEAVTSYNAVYGPGGTAPFWPKALTYPEFVDRESELGFQHILSGVAWPHYMHQTNLREYASGRSLATDWVRAVLDKYAAASTLPLRTLRWNDLGVYVDARTRYEGGKDGLSAVWDRKANTVQLRSASGTARVFMTGTAGPSGAQAETYAGRSIALFNVGTGGTSVSVTPR